MIRIKLLLVLLIVYSSAFSQKKIDLSGTWRFAIDRADKGTSEEWFKKILEDKIVLPGSMTSNGKGDEISLTTPWTGQIVDSSFYKNPEYAKFRQPGNIKVPFWLQPLKYYKGAAWYQKEVNIPESWKDKSIELFLERCHWESRLWIDSKEIGMRNSLGTPHLYDLTGSLSPGKHRITLCIDNRVKDIDPGINSHSISDHTQTNWNGVVGKMYLEERPLVNIKNIQVYPDIENKKFNADIRVNNPSNQPLHAELKFIVTGDGFSKSQLEKVELAAGENALKMQFLMGSSMKLWSEFHPSVYKLTAVLTDQASKKSDTLQTSFGMREFKAVGKQLEINGNPLFLRGTLECAIFPKTGYPATDIKDWLRIFKICRAHGLNNLTF
jgi:beta-galactosidase/beta-glucuronidase